MFTLNLHYPDDSRMKGAVETIRSTYIPPIGMEIYNSRSAAFRVATVVTGITDGVLDEEINVLLEVKDGN